MFFKDDSSLDAQLTLYESLVPPAGEQRRQFDRDLWALRQGVSGEKRIRFELSHSHMPMYVLRDLNLAVGDLTAQIDFLLVTRKQTFVVECKNLFGDITIDETGAFTRTIHYPNGHYKKEGIYSPITQNQRHLDLIRQMRSEQKNVFDRIVFNHYFTQSFESVVVLANDETILRTSRAPKEITHQVIRSDQLIKHLRNRVAVSRNDSRSDKQLLQIAEVFLAAHTPHPLQHPVWATDVIVPKHALGVDTSSLTTNQPQPERALPADDQFRIGVFQIGKTIKNIRQRRIRDAGGGGGNDHGAIPSSSRFICRVTVLVEKGNNPPILPQMVFFPRGRPFWIRLSF